MNENPVNRRGGLTAVFLFVAVICGESLAAPASCDSLTSLSLGRTSITSAKVVAAGAFAPPQTSGAPVREFRGAKSLPEFCRVQGVSKPSTDSHIEFEVWLPVSAWNGKYQGAGNGGFGGEINYSEMAAALVAGYATASTDTGHQGGPTDAKWALGHREKIADYGHRAIHETAVNAKALIRAFYGELPKRSYFSSCSNGGRQGLMEAQRYPADYDGIIAGAPAAHFTRITAAFDWDLQAMAVDPAGHIPSRKMPAIEAAALAACDALDSVKDGVIDDPTRCTFSPAVLRCAGPESDSCLTERQITTLQKLYAGPRTSRGEPVFPGLTPGAETGPGGWPRWVAGPTPESSLQFAFASQAGPYLLHQDPSYSFRTFNVDRDVRFRDEHVGPLLNAVNPDLSAFKRRGGKLILYHGWSDAALPPMGTVNYYQSVVAKMGAKTVTDFVRLYMMPGVQHCGGGPGPNEFGTLPAKQANPRMSVSTALERWVENGVAPDAIIATKYKTNGSPASGVLRTRPLCPYPQTAQYKGSGSTDEASSFECKAR
jgi:tannase/feruloyl esterase